MMAMRYGSLPIVRQVGGLKDTVDNSVGYIFKDYSSLALQKAIIKALHDFSFQVKVIDKKRQNSMNQDFSWTLAAAKYFKLYQKMVK